MVQEKSRENEELLKKFNESMNMLSATKSETQSHKHHDDKENQNINNDSQSELGQSDAMTEIKKVREQMQLLMQSVNDIKTTRSQSKKNRFNSSKRGVRAMMHNTESEDEESGLDQDRLSSEHSDEEVEQVRYQKKNRSSSKTKF